MSLKILIKRDAIENFSTLKYVPKEFELVAAYDVDTRQIIYKLGDGKSSWTELAEITKLSELDKFIVYTNVYTKSSQDKRVLAGPEIYLNPFMCDEIIKSSNKNKPKEVTVETINLKNITTEVDKI